MAGIDTGNTRDNHIKNPLSSSSTYTLNHQRTVASSSGYSTSSTLVGLNGGFEAGQTLNGEIIDLLGKNVRLLLTDGRVISARLETAATLFIGQNASFAVTSSQPNSMSLKLLADEQTAACDITLDKALDEAGLPHTNRNISAVRCLLDNRMSVDKKSIHNLLNHMIQNKSVSANTIALLIKHNIPINQVNASQLEAYRNYEHRLLKQAEQISDSLESCLSSSTATLHEKLNINLHVLDLFNSSYPKLTDGKNQATNHTIDSFTKQSDLTNPVNSIMPADSDTVSSGFTQHSAASGIGEYLAFGELSELSDKIGFLNPDTDFTEKLLNGSLTDTELNNTLHQLLSQTDPDNNSKALSELFGSREYLSFIRHSLRSKLTLDPSELSNADKVADFYKEFTFEISKLNELSSKINLNEGLSENTSKAADNLDFMATLNNIFPYFQLPLRMAAGDTHGELYVYTRKGRARSPEDAIKVLLHLDMEHLGPTDINIEMKHNKLNLHFYTSDEDSCGLFADTLSELEDILSKKGFSVTVSSSLHEAAPHYIEDALSYDEPVGTMKRYSFDIRA